MSNKILYSGIISINNIVRIDVLLKTIIMQQAVSKFCEYRKLC